VTFEPGAVKAAALRDAIGALGYEVEDVEPRRREDPAAVSGPRLSFPENLPPALDAAVQRARAESRILVVDFWATWCGPCQKLKKQTLAAAAVKRLLEGAELVLVDVDEYPSFARAWGVKSVPDVVFLTPDGRVQDRLHGFEGPAAFAKRLRAAVAKQER